MKYWYALKRPGDFMDDYGYKKLEEAKEMLIYLANEEDYDKDLDYNEIAILDEETGYCYGIITLKEVLEEKNEEN